jgi:zinc transport system ATP-binding protein
METTILQIKNLTVGYNEEPVLKDVFLDVKKRDFIGIIGPNGGGKTTFVKTILGFIKPYNGRITFPNGPISIGYLPQISMIDRTFPINVRDVIESGLKSGSQWWPRLNRSQKEKVNTVMKDNGILQLANRPIEELSGGQLQRVMLSRALVNEPQLLILDEPNTYVDKNFEGVFYGRLSELNQHMAILLVSHDIGTISSMVKTIACVNGSLHYHPGNKITAEQMKSYNCPIELIAHGQVPHRVLKTHEQ